LNRKLLFLFFIGSLTAQAQTSVYHPFPDSGAVWRVSWGAAPCAQFNQPQAEYQYEIPGDTLIGSYQYHKVVRVMGYGFYMCGPSYLPGGGYMGAIRQDTLLRRVYFLPKDSIAENLLYDFNLLVGDTVHGFFLEPFTFSSLIVTDIDSILIGLTYRKRFKCEGSNLFHTNFLVEGIGNITSGLLEPPDMFDLTPLLRCFIQDSMHLYSIAPCDLPNSTENYSNEESSIILFPNPATSEIRIENQDSRIEAVEIYDVVGGKVFSEKQESRTRNQVNIDVSFLAAGIYFVRVRVENGSVTRKLIKQ
jgi:hypothetical protein